MTSESLQVRRKKAIAECIGQVTLQWAHLEFLIDALVAYFHTFFHGKIIEKYRPRAFGRKAAYLRASFTRLETMQWASPYLPVLEQLESAAKFRNWFIHGHLTEANDDQTIKFVRHSFDGSPFGLETKTFKYDEIYDLAKNVHHLAIGMKGLLEMVMDFIDKHINKDLAVNTDTDSSDVTVQLVGVSAKAEVGRVAAKGVSRIGKRGRGKYDHEALRGQEFSEAGHLMEKERIIDRKNDYYKELVINTDTGEVVLAVEQPLSEHIGHGSAKHKKQT
ncbi:hypothetical protein [Methylocaldum gracile]|nr:hypothetical protein [Methylocaldum sp. BRCS4]